MLKKNILISSICMTIFYLMTLLPVVLLAYVTKDMVDIFFGERTENISIIPYLLSSILIFLLIFFSYKLTYRKKYYAAGRVDQQMRMELADQYRKLPLSYLQHRDISDLTSIIMDDVSAVSNMYANAMTEMISGVMSGVIALLFMFVYNAQMALSLAAALPIAGIAMALSKYISIGANRANKEKKLGISEGLQEYLENIKTLRVSAVKDDYQKELARKIKGIIPGLVLHELLAGLSISISYNVMRLGMVFVIVTGARLLIAGEISLMTMLFFIYMSVRLYEPLTKASESMGEYIYSLVSVDRIKKIMEEDVQTGDENVELHHYDIAFDHVRFGYDETEVLHDISFIAKQGEITALVGPSGCGKSTLTKLVARFHDVDEGKITVGGIDVKAISPETLLKNISVVFQDVVLFNDTIYNNIRIGKENATKEEIIAAARLAQCNEFIEKLPDGYDTVIGENGKTLSGGERQRLSIARAFLKDAPIILLDESTASIDPENETKIQQAIGKLIVNKTVIIIAHKLRSIVECDKIIVLDAGNKIDEGNHDTLMAEKGLYYALYSLQNESLQWQVNQ